MSIVPRRLGEHRLKRQANLELDSSVNADEINLGGYVCRAIATNRDGLSD